MSCPYCGKEKCQVCAAQAHLDIFELMNDAEKGVVHTSQSSVMPIGVWVAFRDAVNDYFNRLEEKG